MNKSGPRAVSVAHIAAENGRKVVMNISHPGSHSAHHTLVGGAQVLQMLMKAKANLLATDHATGEMPLHFSAKGQVHATSELVIVSIP